MQATLLVGQRTWSKDKLSLVAGVLALARVLALAGVLTLAGVLALAGVLTLTSQKMAFLKLLVPHIPRLCPQVWEVSKRQHCKWRTPRTGHQSANLHLPEYCIRTSLLEIQPLLVSAGVSPHQAFPNKRPLRSLYLSCDPLQQAMKTMGQ